MKDVIIIGTGIAGLTASIYTGRKGLATTVIGEKYGGQIIWAEHIENFAGFTGSGIDLIEKIKGQAKTAGAEILTGSVQRIEKKADGFRLTTAKGESLDTRSIILACGKIPKRLGIPGEDKFMGKGVHVCATCDAPLYKDKVAAVVGGGNSAVEAALSLSAIAKKVYLVNRSESFRCDDCNLEKLKGSANVEILLNSLPVEVTGDRFVTGLVVEDALGGQKKPLAVDGVFVEIGYAVNAEIVKGMVKLNERNEVVTDRDGNTSYKGIFACGDVSDSTYKQAIIAAGDGARAALSAFSYLNGGMKTTPDWRH